MWGEPWVMGKKPQRGLRVQRRVLTLFRELNRDEQSRQNAKLLSFI